MISELVEIRPRGVWTSLTRKQARNINIKESTFMVSLWLPNEAQRSRLNSDSLSSSSTATAQFFLQPESLVLSFVSPSFEFLPLHTHIFFPPCCVSAFGIQVKFYAKKVQPLFELLTLPTTHTPISFLLCFKAVLVFFTCSLLLLLECSP